MKNKIDIVITWVDGNDEDWLLTKRQCQNAINSVSDDSDNRYRDWDTLKYLFRSIEQYLPWINKVFLVTSGHLPIWINKKYDKLVIIKHEDYIPSKYLPTFNSNTIELNFNRIKNLSENFIYFNDDMIALRYCKPCDFFKNDLPCEIATLSPYIPTLNSKNYAQILNMEIINKYFKKNETISKNIFKWFNIKYGTWNFKTLFLLPWKQFPGMKTQHIPSSLKKSTLDFLWKKEYDLLDETCSCTFRNKLNCNQWLISNFQVASGKFYPRSKKFGKSVAFDDNDKNNENIIKMINNSKYKMICLNDNITDFNKFLKYRANLIIEFEKKFPKKSKYEI